MNHDELDRLLRAEREIIPSSGFTASVMNAVRVQAEAPPPIPFPWKRALPGIFALVLVLALVFAWIISAGVSVLSSKSAAALSASLPPAVLPLWHVASWLLVALIATVASLVFSSRFVSRTA
jgi:hypothetical protein